MPRHPEGIDEEHHERLERGEHDAVAAELSHSGNHAAAGWVHEQIWDFAAAKREYLCGNKPIDALRCALENDIGDDLDEVIDALKLRGTQHERDLGAQLLLKRGRAADSASLVDISKSGARPQADAMLASGDSLEAVRLLIQAGNFTAAFDVLSANPEPSERELAMLAEVSWEQGALDLAVKNAQQALAHGSENPKLANILGRSLQALGYELGASLVLNERLPQPKDASPPPARYRVSAVIPTQLPGSAYAAIDRATQEEVELHLLLSDHSDPSLLDATIIEAINSFFLKTQSALALNDPGIRSVLRLDASQGLLVVPRAEGVSVRSLIRPPGMLLTRDRARSMIIFLLRALARAHQRGIVHGAIYPSQLICDQLGRPQLSCFGSHMLSGMLATHTESLEEVLRFTAPETKSGATPTASSDIYHLGAIYRALLLGEFQSNTVRLPEPEGSIVHKMMSEDPSLRPEARTLLDGLNHPIADLSRLSTAVRHPVEATPDTPPSPPRDRGLGKQITVTADDDWTDQILDELCCISSPWVQSILDRNERTFYLAPWPQGCRRASDEGWRESADELTAHLPQSLSSAIRLRLTADTMIVTPTGEKLIALDGILPSPKPIA